MDGLECGNTQCGQILNGDEAFCGYCGTPVPGPQRIIAPPPGPMSWPGTVRQPTGALNGQQDAGPALAGAGVPFFSHESPRRPGPLTNATRYLCAAAYLDNKFANQVIGELIATRRAVAPSLNMDLGPIIWHSQRARRILLIRNIVLAAILLLGFIVSWPAAINFLLYTFLLGWLLPRVRWRQRGLAMKILFVILALYLLPLILFVSFALTVGALASSFTSTFGSGASLGSSAASAAVGVLTVVGTLILVLALTCGTEFAFTYVTRRTLVEQLAPGAPPPPPAPGLAADRTAMVEGAQWGNIALYATEDPFIGAGVKVEVDVDRRWSIAIRLDPADPAHQLLQTRPAPDGYVPIDPVELHQAIRAKLLSLNDPRLPVNERIAGLSVADRLVGSGLLRLDSPLVDKTRMTPYSRASQEAVGAIIRHPQAGLRYYQHVAVNDEGPPVTIGGDRLVLDGADQGIAISAFVYAAVEGRHFYLQFVLTALPPILPEYREIDLLPSLSSWRSLGWMAWYSLKRFLRDAADAPAGIASAIRLWLRELLIEQNALHALGRVAGDLGAEVSVREMGTWNSFGSHICLLDVEKYNRIIERAVLETVQDFLADKGVDISAFSNSALNIINGDVIGVSGNGNQVATRRSTIHPQSRSRP